MTSGYQLIKQIKAAENQWIKTKLQLAVHLREARQRFPSERAFRRWLLDEQINIEPDDRTMGKHFLLKDTLT